MNVNQKKQGKELLFSVTAEDCEWHYFCAGDKDGQHQNKTASAVRCVHKDSGAVGISRDHREQRRNKVEAFRRMYETKEFQTWLKLETSRRLVSDEEKREHARLEEIRIKQMEADVDRMMRDEFLKVEMKDAKGRWVPFSAKEPDPELTDDDALDAVVYGEDNGK